MSIIDTTGGLFPEGIYRFKVSDVPERTSSGGYVGYNFAFETLVNSEVLPYHERFMIWLLAPLLGALGFPEVKTGVYDFEETMALGREVMATIKHEKVKKKSGEEITVARMKDIKPAPAQAAPTAPAAMRSGDDISF